MADSPHTDKHSAPSSPEDIPNARPVMVDMRPEILVLSSAIRDGLNQTMQPMNTTLQPLSRTVIALQHKLHPPSHYGLGSEASTSMLQSLHLLSGGQGVSYLACLGPHHLRSRSLGYTQLHPMLLLGLELHHCLHHPDQGTGECPWHSLQPPSFFGLGTTTEVDVEVIEPVGGDSLSIHASDAEKAHPNLWLPSLLCSARILPSQWRRKLLPWHLIWLSVLTIPFRGGGGGGGLSGLVQALLKSIQ